MKSLEEELSGTEKRTLLREQAEALIHDNKTSPLMVFNTLGIDALELLHRRASNPDFAADALKLLHELQTHQVELDLMHEQMQADNDELTNALAHYKALYDQAPVPYLIVDPGGNIIESNLVARHWLGLGTERLTGHQINDLLAPSSRAAVRAMINSLGSGSSTKVSCVVDLSSEIENSCRLTLEANLGPTDGWIFMVLSPGPITAAP